MKPLKKSYTPKRKKYREMVRAPCCEKMGMKKGPWTPDEDQILISYIQKSGHGNWRALPKQAGLLRCGKSCRLRWINYLRPDIKRGNFTQEEEETVVKLHQVLGNRWSAIAASLPGRTDNEIKNYWNSHLKKRLKQNLVTKGQNMVQPADQKEVGKEIRTSEIKPNFATHQSSVLVEPVASQHYTESAYLIAAAAGGGGQPTDLGLIRKNPVVAESEGHHHQFAFSHVFTMGDDSTNMDFWYKLFMEAESSTKVQGDSGQFT